MSIIKAPPKVSDWSENKLSKQEIESQLERERRQQREDEELAHGLTDYAVMCREYIQDVLRAGEQFRLLARDVPQRVYDYLDNELAEARKQLEEERAAKKGLSKKRKLEDVDKMACEMCRERAAFAYLGAPTNAFVCRECMKPPTLLTQQQPSQDGEAGSLPKNAASPSDPQSQPLRVQVQRPGAVQP